jgi:hypothetical protein
MLWHTLSIIIQVCSSLLNEITTELIIEILWYPMCQNRSWSWVVYIQILSRNLSLILTAGCPKEPFLNRK